jgi:hypothetical protein
MGEYFKKKEGACSLFTVAGEADLKLRPGLNFNPPPTNGSCDVCGRHISELKPFGLAGDPLAGDFDGVFLIKFFRPETYLGQEELDVIYESSERSPEDPNIWIVPDFEYYQGCEVSWECRDCIVMSDEEYFEKKWPESEKKMEDILEFINKKI